MTPLLPKAICEEIVRQYRDDDRGKCPAGRAWWEENVQPELIARAALEAMREPTEEMVKAGEQEFFEYREEPADWTLKGTREAWRAMIDTALSEKTK